MLGELVEQELNGMSAPQDVPIDHGDITPPEARPWIQPQPPSVPYSESPVSGADHPTEFRTQLGSPAPKKPQRPAGLKNLGLASVLHASQSPKSKQKAAGFNSSVIGLSGPGATVVVDSPAFIVPKEDIRKSPVDLKETPQPPSVGPPRLLVSDGDSEATPRTSEAAEDARPLVKVPASAKLERRASQHSRVKTFRKQETSVWSSRRGNASIVSKLIRELEVGQSQDHLQDMDQVTGLRGRVKNILSNGRFELALAATVLANSFVLGLQVDEAMAHSGQSEGFRILDTVFALIFLSELLLRIYAERYWFFGISNPNVRWNGFDSVVILVSVLEEILKVVDAKLGAFASVSVLRMLRVLRIVRVLRTVRLLRYFRDLRVMIMGIFASMKSLTWAMALLMMLMYLTAVLVVDTLTDYREEAVASRLALEMYGSVATAMYTLFKSILGGIDWGDAAQPLYDLNVAIGLAFSLYVAFSVLCVLNIVTGVFVENATRQTSKSEEEVLVERLQARQKQLEQAKTTISRLHDSSTIDKDDFEDLIRNIEFQAVLRKLDVQLEPEHARGLFGVIDFDGTGSMQVDELVSRIDQLHGTAKSIDLMRLMHVHRSLHRRLELLTGEAGSTASVNHHESGRPAAPAPALAPALRQSRTSKASRQTGKSSRRTIS